jgi:primary-amine oxidase
MTDNVILLVEASQPDKAQVLPYLDGAADAPPKFAHAVIAHAGEVPATIKDWLIGPLPISHKTTVRQLTEIYHEPTVPYNGLASAVLIRY